MKRFIVVHRRVFTFLAVRLMWYVNACRFQSLAPLTWYVSSAFRVSTMARLASVFRAVLGADIVLLFFRLFQDVLKNGGSW
jgi:hypothetical protein